MELTNYEDISSVSNRDAQRAKVLALVRAFPYRTARELSRKVNDDVLTHDAIHKRLPELRNAGRVRNHMIRHCAVTGKKAMTWEIV